MKQITMFILTAFLFSQLLLLQACQTKPSTLSEYKNNTYLPLISKLTLKQETNSGLDNVFTYKATIINRSLAESQIKIRSLFQQWDETTKRKNTSITNRDLLSETKIFLSFFSPKRDLQDLSSKKSPWKFYLTSKGKRYPGTVKAISDNGQNTRSLYPHIDKWSDNYYVTFKVPTHLIEKDSSSLTLTSSAGKGTVNFPAN